MPHQETHLPRLEAAFYRGPAMVHWSMTVRDRARGWSDRPAFHPAFRENLLHSLFRFHVACPIYCVMPDHVHLLLAGWSPEADQIGLMRFFRRHLNRLLALAPVGALARACFVDGVRPAKHLLAEAPTVRRRHREGTSATQNANSSLLEPRLRLFLATFP